MKLFVLTSVALLASGATYAQTMSNPAATTPATNAPSTTMPGAGPAARAPAEQMTPPSAANTMARESMTESMAREKVASAGYGAASSLTRNADGSWNAMAKTGNKQQRVTVASDGTVTPKAPM